MAAPTYIDDYTRQFALHPATTALLIVDVQYASASRPAASTSTIL